MNRPQVTRCVLAAGLLAGVLAQVAHAVIPARPSDFDGNGVSEMVVFRPSDGTWHRRAPYFTLAYGVPGDIPVAADYTGDGLTDVAVWRPSNATWYIANVGNMNRTGNLGGQFV